MSFIEALVFVVLLSGYMRAMIVIYIGLTSKIVANLKLKILQLPFLWLHHIFG